VSSFLKSCPVVGGPWPSDGCKSLSGAKRHEESATDPAPCSHRVRAPGPPNSSPILVATLTIS